MAELNDVARYIIECQDNEISTMKLQKLMYYSQAWSLVWDEEPLFNSKIEAWANGPVVRELFNQHRGHFIADIDMFPGDSANLEDYEKETVDAVLRGYGHLTGQQLSDLSHSELPWRKAREGVEGGAASTNEVSLDEMQQFYSWMQSQAAV